MPISTTLLLFLTHGLPVLFFTYMIIDILKRNKRRVDHLIAASISFAYLLLFAEEIVRNLSDIQYSSILSSVWFSSTGILTLCLGLHFVLATTKLNKKLSPFKTCIICYFPILFIVFNIISGAQLFSTQSFEQIGMWIYPVYNLNYYMTLVGSLIANTLIILLLYFINKKTSNKEEKKAYTFLLNGLSQVALISLLLGLLPLQSILPPYPYLYSGLYFCYILKIMMKRFDFLEQHDKRYEKLFTMNPDAIILLDENFNLRELNAPAHLFFEEHQITIEYIVKQLNEEQKTRLFSEEKIENMELDLIIHDEPYHFLLNVDQLSINFEPHRFFIIRNITEMKKQQQQIFFFAYHDTLTEIPNRRYFFEQLEEVLPDVFVKQEVLALYLIDMNNLKMLNDIMGHDAGDAAIKTLANVLKNIVKDNGMAARIGGDEFMVFLNETLSEVSKDEFIYKVQHQFANEISKYENIPIGISIGCSHYPTDSINIDTLVRLADQNMYEMKKLKKVHYR